MINFINDNTFKLAKLSGIYSIINTANNRFYIGESMNIKRRFKAHLNSLRNKNHHNYELQNDFNRYGEDVFEFKILQPHISYNEMITKAELLIIENQYIKMYKEKYNIYNIQDSLDDFLLGKPIVKIPKEDMPYFNGATRNYIVSILLKNDVKYIDDHFFIVRHPVLADITKYKPQYKRHQREISKIPKDIVSKFFQLKEIKTVDENWNPIIKQSYKLIDKDGFYNWLRESGKEEIIETMEFNISKSFYNIFSCL